MPPSPSYTVNATVTFMGRGLKLGWHWVGVCPHGTSRLSLFGSRELIQSYVRTLAANHRSEVNHPDCRCLIGEVTFSGGPDA